jgi:CheY-like chemotaxis protein
MTKRARILVVDDDEGTRLVFSRVLELEGYEVRAAPTAESALADLHEHPPDAILLDFRMPMVNGAGFLYRLREDPTHADIPVAIVTGESWLDDQTANELRALDANVWFKPLSVDQILRLAESLLSATARSSE